MRVLFSYQDTLSVRNYIPTVCIVVTGKLELNMFKILPMVHPALLKIIITIILIPRSVLIIPILFY